MPSQPAASPAPPPAVPPTGVASAILVAWGNAWLAGHCGLDEVADRLEHRHGPQTVAAGTEGDDGAGPGPDAMPLRWFLGELRAGGLRAFRLALPVPGDPLGLTGPAPFNGSAIEAGEAVLVDRGDTATGLVPGADARGSSYRGLAWARYELARAAAPVPTLAEAEQQLALTLRSAADALLELDVARTDPGSAAVLAGIRRGDHDDPALAPGYPPRAARVAAQAARLAAVAGFGLGDDGAAISGSEADTRRAALRDLERAVRRARVAAYNAVTEVTGR